MGRQPNSEKTKKEIDALNKIFAEMPKPKLAGEVKIQKQKMQKTKNGILRKARKTI